jgi:hypothetical protein
MSKVKAVALNLKDNFREYLAFMFIWLVGIFILGALAFQLYMVFLQVTGNEAKMNEVGNALEQKFDGTYKNDPNNVLYDPSEHIFVDDVVNNVKIGKLAGNRNLAFGVKNILEEYLQEVGYDLTPNAPFKVKAEIVFLDVLTTKKNISIIHNNEEEVVIRMKANVYKDGKKGKDIYVEASSSEISMSTLIIDEGGKFNQQSLSNAIKKACDLLVKEVEKQIK